MTSFRPRRPSAALVISMIALFVALGGTAYALGNNSVGTKQLKNGAVTNKKLANGSVGTFKLRNHSVTAKKINATGLNASTVGGQSPSSFQSTATLLFASVSTSATGASIARGRGAVSAGRLGTGNYFVSFNRSITGCTWLATYGVTNDGASGPLFATVEGRNFTNNPNDVEVRTRDASTAGAPQTDGSGFHIEVLCP